jgi:hypothetical protein
MEVSPEELFPDCFSSFLNKDEVNSIRYLCNYTFLDVLDVTKNNKFPGQLVVSLDRNDLECFRGLIPFHVPYNKTEIIPWLDATTVDIPPVDFHIQSLPDNINNSVIVKNECLNLSDIEFGPEDTENFVFFSKMAILPCNIDFDI